MPGQSSQTADGDTSPTDSSTGIVVGVDGSPGSAHALRWAARRSARFGPVTPVVAWYYPWWAMPVGMPGGPPPVPPSDFQDRARSEAAAMLDEIDPVLAQALVVHHGPVGQALVERGRNANLIVVGTRGRGAVADAVLGSVSSHVVRHAPVPVAVVPEHAAIDDSHHKVVVGVDGSANAVAALAWAVRNTPPEATLEAVQAWTYQLSSYPEVINVAVEVFEEEARASLERTVAEASAAARQVGGGSEIHEVTGRLEYGDPRHVLMAASAGADLLVLGARGHQGVAHLLVGSVTTSLVHHPTVPTVIVPTVIVPTVIEPVRTDRPPLS